jgi:hypothetical protein
VLTQGWVLALHQELEMKMKKMTAAVLSRRRLRQQRQ